MIQEDRALWKYVIFGLLTCGIYDFYFIYKMAQDVNEMCADDGKKTSGLVVFILLSYLTCGIYPLIWYYSLGNRLAENAPRYGLNFQENGTTVLLWHIFGILLCGIGAFVAMNILIKNTNAMAKVYNSRGGWAKGANGGPQPPKGSQPAMNGQNFRQIPQMPNQKPVQQMPNNAGGWTQRPQNPQNQNFRPTQPGQMPPQNQRPVQQMPPQNQRPVQPKPQPDSYAEGETTVLSMEQKPNQNASQMPPKGLLYFVQTQQSVTIDKDEFRIGKNAGMSDYAITNDSSVSRQHAVIQRKNGQFFVSDLGSTNGTFVNEKRISGTVQLQDGDNIRYADVISVFNIVR